MVLKFLSRTINFLKKINNLDYIYILYITNNVEKRKIFQRNTILLYKLTDCDDSTLKF